MLTFITKRYKTISIKYHLKQNITVLSSIAHGFLNILTADKVNDLKNDCSKRSVKSSNHLPNITENPLDESSLNPHDTTGISSNPTGITSPPPFCAKRPNMIFKMTRFKFLPKRKQYSNQKLHTDQPQSNTPSSLPHCSSVNTNPNDYPLNPSSVECEMDTPVRIYSKTNYSCHPLSFQSNHSDFFTPPALLLIEQLFFNFHFDTLQNLQSKLSYHLLLTSHQLSK